jgi:hypothetical protein
MAAAVVSRVHGCNIMYTYIELALPCPQQHLYFTYLAYTTFSYIYIHILHKEGKGSLEREGKLGKLGKLGKFVYARNVYTHIHIYHIYIYISCTLTLPLPRDPLNPQPYQCFHPCMYSLSTCHSEEAYVHDYCKPPCNARC